MTKVAIVMGSDSDLPVMQEAAKVLEELDVDFDISIVSAHRTPKRMYDFALSAHENSYSVIIAGAGGAAHLPGMIASLTHLPVIGVPVKSKTMSGIDSLYSIVQMPPGVPVATVAINGSKNAGILAAQIIGLANKKVSQNIIDYKKNMEETVLDKTEKLENVNYSEYLKGMGL
jgi:5-(carboxyamino)imidazole ribonucleotide mutase